MFPCMWKDPYCHQMITQTHTMDDTSILEKFENGKNFRSH